jgi:phage terminase large subunit
LTNLAGSIARRLEYRAKIGSDPGRQALELAYCAIDPVHWFNRWAWTFDPRLLAQGLPAFIPFDLFPRQEDYIRWLKEREAGQEQGLVEKSRDAGVSWIDAGYAVHGYLFRPGFVCGFGSRKLELVDTIGDPDSIFEKIRILLRNLPAWMMPAGFSWKVHDNFCKLIHPSTGATLNGEGGDDIGRGGRASLYFVDEAAFLARASKVDAALSQTSNVLIWVSTPNGPGNQFYKKRFGGKIAVFIFDWREDPRKDDAWYEKQKATLDPVVLAQEVDRDYSASIEGICIPAQWVKAAVEFREWLKAEKGIELPVRGPKVAGLDIAEEGKNKSVFIERQGPQVEWPSAFPQANTTQTAWKARDEALARKIETINYDVIGVGVGVKGTWDSSEAPLPFTAVPINGGSSPTETIWPGGKTSADLFLNLRAELWWRLRLRFEKTYEVRQGIGEHPLDECISLPNCAELIADLSLPLAESTETGKIRIESKAKMAQRGVKSPDYADALVYAYAESIKTEGWAKDPSALDRLTAALTGNVTP